MCGRLLESKARDEQEPTSPTGSTVCMFHVAAVLGLAEERGVIKITAATAKISAKENTFFKAIHLLKGENKYARSKLINFINFLLDPFMFSSQFPSRMALSNIAEACH
jgi:hypothetical protein